jgi:hypothetical protein
MMIAIPSRWLEIVEQRQDLRLHRHVELGGRLIRDQQLRFVGERHRDHTPLAHAARELVWILVHAAAGNGDPDQLEQLDCAGARVGLRNLAVGEHRLHQLRGSR